MFKDKSPFLECSNRLSTSLPAGLLGWVCQAGVTALIHIITPVAKSVQAGF